MMRFNKSELIWLLILFGFSFYLFYIVLTGKIGIFINPKMVKYTIFSAFAFIVLALYQIRKVFMISRNNKVKFGYILLLLPLILGFFAQGFDFSIADTKGVTIIETSKVTTNTTDTKAVVSKISKSFIEDGVVVFRDVNFYEILDDINYNINEYQGKKVKISGIVYRDKTFKDNEFVISRMVMSCCAADSQIVGLMSKLDNAKYLNNGEWVKIEGTINNIIYKNQYSNKDEEMPIIMVNKIDRNQTPGEKYVYPPK